MKNDEDAIKSNSVIHEISGNRVSRFRKKKCWSRENLALKMKIPKSLINKYELPFALVPDEHLTMLCSLLSVKPSQLAFLNDLGREAAKAKLARLEVNLIAKKRRLLKQTVTTDNKKKKKIKHVPRSISNKLILSSGFESNRRRH